MKRIGPILLACALAVPVVAQDRTGPTLIAFNAALVGDIAQGRVIADQICSECHNVQPTANAESPASPPTFTTIASTPGMTETALTVWLTTFHPERTMPGIQLSMLAREDVIAYILSLGE